MSNEKNPITEAGTPAEAKLLLLDGHSLAFRAFFAIPPGNFTTTGGQHTNAVFGFFTQLVRLVQDEQPTHIGVAFDVSRKTLHRTAEYPEYKATRSAPPAEWHGQVELIRQTLAACGIFTTEKEGFEADDIIATLATRAGADGIPTYISTGDRDALQLVSDQVTVLYPKQGSPTPIRYTPAEVEEKYGVAPAQYPDLAALRGDPSDNLPGVPKVGEKTAAKWLGKYGSLDEIIAKADEFGGKLGENLREALPDVQRNRRLTELDREVDLDFSVADLARHPLDAVAVTKQLDALQFGPAFRERLFEAFGTSGEVPEAEQVELDVECVATDGVAAWLGAHQAERYGVDLAGDPSPSAPDLTAVTLATAEGAVAYIDLAAASPDDEVALEEFFADAARTKVVHDSKAARHELRSRNWQLDGVVGDCSLAAYLVHPGQRTYALPDLVLRHLQRELYPAGEPAAQMSLLDDAGSDAELARHAGQSAHTLLELYDRLDTELEAVHGTRLLEEMELPLARVLADCEAAGIAVDRSALEQLRSDFIERAEAAQQQAWDAIGDTTVNLGSPKQLQKVLFEDLGLPKTKRTKTGYTTDAKAIEELQRTTVDETGQRFLAALLDFRDATKMKQNVEGLIKAIADDGRIHTSFRQTVTATGRLSSTDPNLQNIPVRTADGRRIRAAFVVGSGYECLLTADYSQIEMRVMAHLSGDEGLIEAFRSGEDLHSFVGSRAFGVALDEVTPELRRRTKAMSYGLAYGLSAFGLAAQLGITQGEAKEQMDAYFARFGGVRDFLHGVVEEARRNGYTETLLGRRRRLPELSSTNRIQREGAERAALNAPIQGTAADIIKIAMLRAEARLRAEKLASRMLLQVHDELVLEVAPGELDQVRALVVEEMDKAIELSVPLEVSVGIGPDWDTAGH